MDLPVMPPVDPMLAKPVKGIPDPGRYPDGLLFEPKWDGFRALIFKDGDEVEIASRNTKPLTRYFPELVESLRACLPARCVLDGEIVVEQDGRLEFEVLQERIHPAASRIALLAQSTPASFVAFDLLALAEEDLTSLPFAQRRSRLEGLGISHPQVHLTPVTTDPEVAEEWFSLFEGAGLDGVMAKPAHEPYQPGARAMLKIKHARTADCVVAGYRLHKNSTPEHPLLGSLLLGLYSDAGELAHVGVSASFTAVRRAELATELADLACPLAQHPWGAWAEGVVANPDRVPGTASRWSQGKDLSFVPIRPERVVEVGYDHMEGRRFRHTAQFKRWRPDRDPESCTYDQLERPVRYSLEHIFETDG